MNIGKWRIRPRVSRREYSAVWFDRTVFTEGTVYRAALTLWQLTVMVDCQSQIERNKQLNEIARFFGIEENR